MNPSNQDNEKSLRFFAFLMGLVCLGHLSIHLPAIALSGAWISGAAVLVAAGWVMGSPKVKPLLVLAICQCTNVILDAPYNPDHWLLLFFVNLTILASALWLWIKERKIDPQRLMQRVAPAGRIVFLICYGFAALAKYNSDFLFSSNSAAHELFQLQVGAMPSLKWFVWTPMIPWVSILCETLLPVLLLFKRTRGIGILVGIAFHTALIVSPAVKVYDFTLAIVAMLYLFTGSGFESKIKSTIASYQDRSPAVFGVFRKYKWGFVYAPILAVLVMSCFYALGSTPPRVTRIRGGISLFVVVLLGSIYLIGLVGRLTRQGGFRWMPRGAFAWLVIAAALLNGLCPYLGLKTQGSFTMFSNVQTEDGRWNHFLMPQAMQVFSQYQDRLIKIVDSNNDRINRIYVSPELLATEFEVQRMVLAHPGIKLTLEQDGRRIEIDGQSDRSELNSFPSLLARKLMVFRPVSPDGRPFMTN